MHNPEQRIVIECKHNKKIVMKRLNITDGKVSKINVHGVVQNTNSTPGDLQMLK